MEREGAWAKACKSVNRMDRYAFFYKFTLASTHEVVIDLTSNDQDTYLYLLAGAGKNGSIIALNDDIDRHNRNYNSQITKVLNAGAYTIEATTYHPHRKGSFNLAVTSLPPPARVLTPNVTPGDASLTVSWTVPPGPITNYQAQHKQATQASWPSEWSIASNTNMTISALTIGTSYDVRVRACNRAGCGPWSLSGAGTSVTNPSVLPTRPIGVGANGNIVDGEISTWWQASAGAASYSMRYAAEVCTETLQTITSVCTTHKLIEISGIESTNKSLTAGSHGSQLNGSQVYLIQVRAKNTHGWSNWSEAAYVYPANAPPVLHGPPIKPNPVLTEPRKPPLIGTSPLYGYQQKNEGIHEFNFIVCVETIPADISIKSSRIAAAIEKWEDAIMKDSSGNDMIQTTRTYHSAPKPDDACEQPSGTGGVFPTGNNEVMFVDDMAIDGLHCGMAPACWRVSTWDHHYANPLFRQRASLPIIAEGTLLLRETRSKGGNASDWNELVYNNACSYLEHTITHEAGHALGIGWPLNDHPRFANLSIMSAGYTHYTRYCEPQAYDILAVMANYQSR